MSHITQHECQKLHEQCKRHNRGDSFPMHDPAVVFEALDLHDGSHFLDVGCGMGNYSLHAAAMVGESGRVCALERDPNRIAELRETAAARGLSHIEAVIADVTRLLPVADDCMDAALIVTVLHTLNIRETGEGLFRELRRVLKPSGRLVTIDCKKEEMDFGPPMHMRLTPQEIEAIAGPCGFETAEITDMGFTYMIRFTPKTD